MLHATEGVWGFACDPYSNEAVGKILAIKGRSADKGFILIGACSAFFQAQLCPLEETKRAEILATWPGSHTWILPDSHYPDRIRGGRETVACRVPGHAQARALCAGFGRALVSTSANLSGQPSVTDAKQAKALFGDLVDYMLPGTVGQAGKASTIHALDGSILR